ncbi:unnamed protein product, partial [Ectocarpus sp. 12 AP-2014]
GSRCGCCRCLGVVVRGWSPQVLRLLQQLLKASCPCCPCWSRLSPNSDQHIFCACGRCCWRSCRSRCETSPSCVRWFWSRHDVDRWLPVSSSGMSSFTVAPQDDGTKDKSTRLQRC